VPKLSFMMPVMMQNMRRLQETQGSHEEDELIGGAA
jgi:hypothetical protein